MGSPGETNVELVERLYEAFDRGDVEAVVGAMAEDVVWTAPEGDPYGGTHRGPAAIKANVLGPLARDAESLGVAPERLVACGDTVVVEGTVHITATWGKQFEVPFVHVVDVDDGEVVRCRAHLDTHLVRRALAT